MSIHGTVIEHIPCPKCNSSDNVALHEDGYQKCYTPDCGYYSYEDSGDQPVTDSTTKKKNKPKPMIQGEVKALKARGISKEICQKYGYKVGKYKGKPVQIAEYRDNDGKLVGQKLRFRTKPNGKKEFLGLGDMKSVQLFGQHLWRNNNGRKVIVTEGEIDCLSMAEAQGGKWPVVSIPHGASSNTVNYITANIEFLSSFDEVIFMFDMDEAGQKAARQCAAKLKPGKAKIATLPYNDPNETLLQAGAETLVSCMYDAQVYRPDDVIHNEQIWDLIVKDFDVPSIPYPWADLNNKTYGIRKSEIVTLCAGSGVGKSTFCKEIILQSVLRAGKKAGYIALEEAPQTTAKSIVGMHLQKPIHLEPEAATKAEKREAYEDVIQDKLFIYDHWGTTDTDSLLDKIRYFVHGCGVEYVVLDHISMVVAGMDEGDERRIIDNLMHDLRALVQELDFSLIIVSHLKRPDGTPHEEGGYTSLAQLRGSAGIGQMSDIVIGCERNQQADKDDGEQDRYEGNPNLVFFRVLKNRFSGLTGVAGKVEYMPATGRIEEREISILEYA